MIWGLVFEKLLCYAIGYPIKFVCVINRDDRRKLLAAVAIASEQRRKGRIHPTSQDFIAPRSIQIWNVGVKYADTNMSLEQFLKQFQSVGRKCIFRNVRVNLYSHKGKMSSFATTSPPSMKEVMRMVLQTTFKIVKTKTSYTPITTMSFLIPYYSIWFNFCLTSCRG